MIKQPYTNLHELNLDWIIEQLGKDGPVRSINGKTGIVTLTAEDIKRTASGPQTVEYALSTQGNSIQDIRTQIGITPLPTTAQTLTGAIAENAQDISSNAENIQENTDDITDINNQIGSTALPTTAQTVTGAIAEHEQDITSIKNQIDYTALTVTKGSGAETISINARKFGRICVVSGTIDFESAPSAWTNYDIATITNITGPITSTIYVTAMVYGNSGKVATIEINAGENKLVFRPLGNSGYTDLNGRFSLIYPTT